MTTCVRRVDASPCVVLYLLTGVMWGACRSKHTKMSRSNTISPAGAPAARSLSRSSTFKSASQAAALFSPGSSILSPHSLHSPLTPTSSKTLQFAIDSPRSEAPSSHKQSPTAVTLVPSTFVWTTSSATALVKTPPARLATPPSSRCCVPPRGHNLLDAAATGLGGWGAPT